MYNRFNVKIGSSTMNPIELLKLNLCNPKKCKRLYLLEELSHQGHKSNN